jgi:hypothetical protein
MKPGLRIIPTMAWSPSLRLSSAGLMFVTQYRHALLQAAMVALTQELKILIQLDDSTSLFIFGILIVSPSAS